MTIGKKQTNACIIYKAGNLGVVWGGATTSESSCKAPIMTVRMGKILPDKELRFCVKYCGIVYGGDISDLIA